MLRKSSPKPPPPSQPFPSPHQIPNITTTNSLRITIHSDRPSNSSLLPQRLLSRPRKSHFHRRRPNKLLRHISPLLPNPTFLMLLDVPSRPLRLPRRRPPRTHPLGRERHLQTIRINNYPSFEYNNLWCVYGEFFEGACGVCC